MSEEAASPGDAATASNPPREAGKGPWVRVGLVGALPARRKLVIDGRHVTLLRVPAPLWQRQLQRRRLHGESGEARRGSTWCQGTQTLGFVCLDTTCYHAGGPLTSGDIEEVAGRLCLTCPWHHYRVDVETGEGLYMDLGRKWRSKGKRQRVHQVRVADGDVMEVRLSTEKEGEELPSDVYAYGFKFQQRAEHASREDETLA